MHSLATLFEQMKEVSQSKDFRVSERNALYFSHIHNDEMMEEYAYGFTLDRMLGAFDAFFGDDAEYLAFKKTL